MASRLWAMRASAKYHTAPSGALNRLEAISAVADACGVPLLPWVSKALEVATEYEVTDLGEEPLRRRCLVTTPRQSGKSVAMSVIGLEALTRRPDQHGILMAQTRVAAMNRLKGITKLALAAGIPHKTTLGVGNERMHLYVNGGESVLQVMPPTENAAHGESLDLVLLDEVFSLPEIILQGVSPAMAARPEAQLYFFSTQGTLESELLNALTQQGREDPEGPMSFVEYSLPEGSDHTDEDVWWTYHPGLGFTVHPKHLRAELQSMKTSDWLRAYGNLRQNLEEEVIPADWWEQSQLLVPVPDQGVCLAVDVSAYGGSITAAFPVEDGWHTDLVSFVPGDDHAWIVPRVEELIVKLQVEAVAVDTSGPAAYLGPALQSAVEGTGTTALRRMSLQDRSRASHHFYQLLREGTLTHAPSEVMDRSISMTGQQTTGDLWRFSRSRSVGDPAPTISASMAVWLAYEVHELAPRPALHVIKR